MTAVNIKIDQVNLSYGSNHVLKDINLDIRAGELFAFLGPSGCGKTTLLRLIAGFNTADSGRVLLDSQDVSALPPWKRDVGLVFQSYALWPHMTVRRNVAFGLEERKVPRAEIERRVNAALEVVELGALADRRPSQLSGGQQQRVALARTIVVEPKVLLLDEPLSNLDAKLRGQVRRELRELQQRLGLTTIFVTHDQEEANSICDRIAVMNAGVVQQVGTPMELYERPANLFVATFLGSANVIDGAKWVDAPPGAPSGAKLVFRPQAATLSTTSQQAWLKFEGAVAHREFLGSTVRYGVRGPAGDVSVDLSFHQGQAMFEVGQNVTVGVPQSAAMWLSA